MHMFHCLSLIALPRLRGEVKTDSSTLSLARERERGWLSVMAQHVLEKEHLDRGDYVSWSAYHTKRQAVDIRPVSPIF